MAREFYGTFALAVLCRVVPKTIARWTNAGRIPVVRTLGGRRRYTRAAVQDFLRANGFEVPPELQPAPSEPAT